jgi:hypothetical protein
LLQDVGVDHGGGHIVVPEQLLNRADVGAAFQQVGGEEVSKGMGADLFRQTGTASRDLDGLVDDAGVHVMATGDTGTRVDGNIPGGKDVLPTPFLGGLWGLPGERIGQVDVAMPLSQILLMQRPDPGQVILEQGVSVAGEVVKRSLSPSPERTSSCFIAKSMSLTLSRTASMIRSPLP